MTDGIAPDPESIACPACGHGDDEHRRESWYDEEGIEGMTCEVCDDAGDDCRWWTWDWREVISGEADHDGPDLRTA